MQLSILTIVSKNGNMVNTLHESLIYIMRVEATQWDYMYGAAVSLYNTYQEMLLVKRVFGETWGKAYFHYILSPHPSEKILLNDFYHAGLKVVELIAHFYGRYQVAMAIHFDKNYYHIHLIANNIDWQTGKRFDLNKKRLYELRFAINEILSKYGISAIKERT